MSYIKKLSLIGVRSFGPDESMVVDFSSPLTLILGQNGSGKTTLIESLKYVTTGDFPPGTNNGASFIHDPKINQSAKVKAQVKLQFCSARGLTMTAVRSMEATQKSTKTEMKTLSVSIAIPDGKGGITTVDGKCQDYLAAMTRSMGVSKAILNSVIFCHQEESNWPLDEGKKVKERFDAIFNTTKYIKALDYIKKKRKDMMSELTSMAKLRDALEKLRDEARRKKTDLEEAKTQQTKLSEEKEQIVLKLAPIHKRINEITKVEEDFGSIRGELSGKTHCLSSLRQIQEEVREGMTEEINCSDAELFDRIEDFEHNLEEAERKRRKLEMRAQEMEREMKRRQQQETEAQRRQGELEAAHNTHKKDMAWRNTRVARLVAEFSFTEFAGMEEFGDEEADAVLSLLEQRVKQERTKTQAKKEEFELTEAKLQSEIDDLRSKEAALQFKIKSMGSQLNEEMQRLRQVKQLLKRSESELSYTNPETIREEIDSLEEKIKAEETHTDAAKMQQDIEDEKRKRSEMQGEVDEAKRKVARMTRQAEDRSQLDIHTREKKELQHRLQILERKHAEEFEHLLGEVPKDNIKNKLDTHVASLRQSISTIRESLNSLNQRKTRLDTTIRTHREQIERKEKEINALRNKVSSVCGATDLDTSLLKTKKAKEDLAIEKGDLACTISVLKKFQERLQEKDCCPLCHRDFETRDEVTLLIEELEEKMNRIPSKLSGVKEKLRDQEQLYDQMVQLQPQRDQAKAAHREMDKIKGYMEEEIKELQTINEEIEQKTELLEITQSDEETANSIQGDVITMENNIRRIRQLSTKIEDLQASLGGSDGEMSMEEAMSHQTKLEESYRKVQQRLEDLQDRLREHQSRLQTFKNRKLELSRKELELKTKMQEVTKLKEERAKLEESHKALQQEVEEAEAEVTPYKYQIVEKTKEKTQVVKDKENHMEAGNKRVSAIVEKQRGVEDVQRSIVRYVTEGGEGLLRDVHAKIATLQEEISSLQDKKKELNQETDATEKLITTQKERKRNLDGEKKIRDKEKEAEVIQEEINTLEKRIGRFDIDTVLEEKEKLNDEGLSLQSERATIDGRLLELKKSIAGLQNDLQRQDIKEAADKYKEMIIDINLTEMAINDTITYCKALDTAIMRFHNEKMRMLNIIVKDLWHQIYKGNDIEYIEIRTKETEFKGPGQRQTYDYRVVMVKNGVEMDMRGRCSAGQKVLASLLIRLALAETFSARCGILTLDEPTTNLDKKNIKSLAKALSEIVQARSRRAGSQLIIISHDPHFLEKLATESLIDDYVEVKRNKFGLSSIVKRKRSEDQMMAEEKKKKESEETDQTTENGIENGNDSGSEESDAEEESDYEGLSTGKKSKNGRKGSKVKRSRRM